VGPSREEKVVTISRSIWEEHWLPKASCAEVAANGHFGAEIMVAPKFSPGTTIADSRQAELMPTQGAALALQEITPNAWSIPPKPGADEQ